MLNSDVLSLIRDLQHHHCSQLASLSELHGYLNQLLLLWETKCARLFGQTMLHPVGQRRKYINIELVGLEIKAWYVANSLFLSNFQLEFMREIKLSWQDCASACSKLFQGTEVYVNVL